MACHANDVMYYKIMTIAFATYNLKTLKCNRSCGRSSMKQWSNTSPKPNFKGFMVDNVQANWNAFKIIYDFGDMSVRMVNKEHTCLFH